MFYFPCSPVHKICLLFTELYNEDKHIFRNDELRKQSANFKQTQHKQIIYFHVNRYIIWTCQRFVKQNKVVRFPVHMKTYHQSTKKCKYRTLEKHSNTYYENKQNINHACACNTYLINSIICFIYLFLNCVFKGVKQLKSVKGPSNTFDLNPKWQRTLPSCGNFLWVMHRVPQIQISRL